MKLQIEHLLTHEHFTAEYAAIPRIGETVCMDVDGDTSADVVAVIHVMNPECCEPVAIVRVR